MAILMTSWYLRGKKRTPRSLLPTGWDSCQQGCHIFGNGSRYSRIVSLL